MGTYNAFQGSLHGKTLSAEMSTKHPYPLVLLSSAGMRGK